MASVQKTNHRSTSIIVLVAVLVIGLLAGSFIGYYLSENSFFSKASDLQDQIADLQSQTSSVQTILQELQENTTRLENGQTNISNDNEATIQNLSSQVAQTQSQLSSLQREINEIQSAPNPPSQNVTALQLKIDGFQSIIESLQQRVVRLESTPPATYQNITYVTGAAASLNPLFEQVKGSVVVVQGLVRQVDFFGRVFYSQVQGSGFVCNYSGRMVILTNNHVINGAINVTVTFNDGTVFSTTTIGSNANTDFAVLNPATSISNYRPLEIISSSMLKVGDPVIVVGTPYGLAGSMSNGIVSALNRTLSTSANVEIYNVIQTTAPLNPGNSGGPVMNYNGQVIGIATAIVQESQGIGFAIPSDTILSELQRILG